MSAKKSLSSWERGLKFQQGFRCPFYSMSLSSWERGLKYRTYSLRCLILVSLSSWERGLKFSIPLALDQLSGRSLHESVDWNILAFESGVIVISRSLHESVDWNILAFESGVIVISRSLHESVDWNYNKCSGFFIICQSLSSWERGMCQVYWGWIKNRLLGETLSCFSTSIFFDFPLLLIDLILWNWPKGTLLAFPR